MYHVYLIVDINNFVLHTAIRLFLFPPGLLEHREPTQSEHANSTQRSPGRNRTHNLLAVNCLLIIYEKTKKTPKKRTCLLQKVNHFLLQFKYKRSVTCETTALVLSVSPL